MSILPQLLDNKGTISSKLGKALAQDALDGDTAILDEAVFLLGHDDKNVRAGAAKIIEQVALKQPGLVRDHLPQLLPALDAPEPQTRWMAIHTLGLCAEQNPAVALQAMPYAQAYLEAGGACLWGSTITYLGYAGATSPQAAQRAYPFLEQALVDLPRQTNNILAAFLRMLDQADAEMQTRMHQHALAHATSDRPSVRTTARRLERSTRQAPGT